MRIASASAFSARLHIDTKLEHSTFPCVEQSALNLSQGKGIKFIFLVFVVVKNGEARTHAARNLVQKAGWML
jgi:hypothetical protein